MQLFFFFPYLHYLVCSPQHYTTQHNTTHHNTIQYNTTQHKTVFAHTCTGGKITIWRIENFEKVAFDEDLYGQFWGGDSYVVLYAYMNGDQVSGM